MTGSGPARGRGRHPRDRAPALSNHTTPCCGYSMRRTTVAFHSADGSVNANVTAYSQQRLCFKAMHDQHGEAVPKRGEVLWRRRKVWRVDIPIKSVRREQLLVMLKLA
jgi:hypothetical protein